MANADAFNSAFQAEMNKSKNEKSQKKAADSINTSPSSVSDLIPLADPSSYKKGGKVKKTGFAKVHKGEVVLIASEAKGHHRGKSSKKKSSHKKITAKR